MKRLRVYNTLTRAKEIFTPLVADKVKMYVCGITAYDLCHLGHARCYVTFDVVHRWLEYLGYDVQYVQNITDLDDKLIKRAQAEGGEGDIKDRVKAVAEKFTRLYFDDMDRLGILRANSYPRATEFIDDMVKIIQELEKKGFAYRRGSNVYFEVARFPSYGQLSRIDTQEVLSGTRVKVEEEKKSPLDFALWKQSAPGEPSWPSPWGEGRPGWHIECSAMSMNRLGPTFDIHGGGQDLIFPHHENERAQSEAFSSHPFTRYWLHNGFVTINREKMSKSLGNVFNLRDIYRVYPPRTVRFFLLSQHYRSPVDYSEEDLSRAGKTLRRLDNCFSLAVDRWGDLSSEEADEEAVKNFEKEMNDDFNTASALALVHDLAGRFFHSPSGSGRRAVSAMIKICEILGIKLENRLERMAAVGEEEEIKAEEVVRMIEIPEPAREHLERMVKSRQILRRSRRWNEADRVRARLRELGVEIRDNPDGSSSVVY